MRHAGDVSMSIIGIGVHHITDHSRAQAVVCKGRLQKALLSIGVYACPARTRGLNAVMVHRHDVSYWIIFVILLIYAHSFAIPRVKEIYTRLVGRTCRFW